MIQDSTTINQRDEGFIRKVCESGIVWGLENDEGLATSDSGNYEENDSEPTGMICFWSESELAGACTKDNWNEFRPVAIPLNEFIENWCIGMSNDGLLIGTNFDENMSGFEVDPLNLIIELSKEIKNHGKEIKLQKYNQLDDLVNEVVKILEE